MIFEVAQSNDRTFDWVPSFDHRNVEYHVSTLLTPIPVSRFDKYLNDRVTKLEAAVFHPTPPSPTPPGPTPGPPVPTNVTWNVPIVLDQGQDGECVGHGFAHAVAAGPLSENIGTQILENPTAESLYESAQRFDGSVPDENSGASTLGGAKAAKAAGLISAYHWCLSITDVVNAILKLGPVVLGIPWTNGMFTPDSTGLVRPTGSVVGGHCLLANGYDSSTKRIRLHNSWGSSWGINGEAFITATDLASLLAQQGDACYLSR